MPDYLSRGIEARLRERLESDPLVILEGARATGKSWLVKHARSIGWLNEVEDFNDPAVRAAAAAAPRDYVQSLPHGTAIDEAQLVPAIMLPMKERAETSPPGSILLTGSTPLPRDGLGGSDPLAGRVGRTLRLGPLTIGERIGHPVGLVSQLFSDVPATIEVGGTLPRSELVLLLNQPGLPDLARLVDPAEGRERSQQYLTQVISRSPFDSLDVQRVERLARHLAVRSSTLLNVQQFAQATELSRETVNRYLARLEEALLLVRLRGWRRSKDKSETDKPKMHFFDAGVASGVGSMRPADDEQALGRLAETFVITELVRQCEWQHRPPTPYHWRRKDRTEVDLILEDVEGAVVAIEVKASEMVSIRDFRGIDAFRQAHPGVFHRGFVFYTGSNVLPFGDDRWAIPFAALRAPATASEGAESLGAAVAAVRVRERNRMKREQSADERERRRRVSRQNQALEEVQTQLSRLGASLDGYKSDVERWYDDDARPSLILRVQPTNGHNKTSWSTVVTVMVEQGQIGAQLERGWPIMEDLSDERPVAQVVSALLTQVADEIGKRIVQLDLRFGL